MKKIYKVFKLSTSPRLVFYKISYKLIFKIYTAFKIITKIKVVIGTKKYLYELDNEDPKDIYISTHMSSGTTWLQMILYQLTTNGDMTFNHIYEVLPYVDQNISSNKKIELKNKTRIFKTHLDYRFFPSKFKGKFIFVVRNGMDVATSQFHHFQDWGNPELTFEESFDKNFINSWFKHTKRWLENKNKYDILYVKFEDLKMNLEGEISRIANFCNINIKEKELSRIIERSSFNFMKKHEDKFGMEIHKFKYTNFIRKGEINTGSKNLSIQQLDIYKKEFKKHLLKFELVKDYNIAKDVL